MSEPSLVPVYDMRGTYASTTDPDLALANGYIGEETLRPKLLANAIRANMGLRQYLPMHVFYYGSPDAELREKFGIGDGVDPAENVYKDFTRRARQVKRVR